MIRTPLTRLGISVVLLSYDKAIAGLIYGRRQLLCIRRFRIIFDLHLRTGKIAHSCRHAGLLIEYLFRPQRAVGTMQAFYGETFGYHRLYLYFIYGKITGSIAVIPYVFC